MSITPYRKTKEELPYPILRKEGKDDQGIKEEIGQSNAKQG